MSRVSYVGYRALGRTAASSDLLFFVVDVPSAQTVGNAAAESEIPEVCTGAFQ